MGCAERDAEGGQRGVADAGSGFGTTGHGESKLVRGSVAVA